MVDVINASSDLGSIIVLFLNQSSGDVFLGLLLITLFVYVFCAAFRLPLELSAVVMIPLFIVSMSLSAAYLAVGGVAALYMGVLFAKWFFR